jgi:two-component system, LuxR family, sensor kinase FixL
MTWITIAWPMVAAACVTLGLIELRVGIAQPPRAARLLFSLSAFAIAAFSGMELALMRVDTVTDFEALLPWMDVAVGVVIVSLTAFIWVFFGTGNKWLALAVPGLYAVVLVFDFLPGSRMT